MHFFLKKVCRMFGWYLKNVYLCIRFPKESRFKEAFFERFTINNKVVQAYIIYKYKETVNNLKRLKIDSGS